MRTKFLRGSVAVVALPQRTLIGSIQPAAGKRRLLAPVVASERQRVFLVSLDADEELPHHTAPGELTLFVVSGSVVIVLAGSPYTLNAGDAILVPMGDEHGIENRTSAPASVLGILQLRGAGEGAGRPSERHLVEGAVIVDALRDLSGATGDGVVWTLDGPSELNVNLVRLEPQHTIEEHLNDAVDVLLVGLAGNGELLVDGSPAPLSEGVVAHVPRGAMRSVRAGNEALRYLSVHRRRSGPVIRSRSVRRSSGSARAARGGATGVEAADGEGSRA